MAWKADPEHGPCLRPPSFSPSAYAFPYLVGLLPKGVEVRTLDTQNLVQTIQLARAKLMTEGDVVYLATTSGVWRLIMIPLINQVDQLVEEEEFEEALSLLDHIKDLPHAQKVGARRRPPRPLNPSCADVRTLGRTEMRSVHRPPPRTKSSMRSGARSRTASSSANRTNAPCRSSKSSTRTQPRSSGSSRRWSRRTCARSSSTP